MEFTISIILGFLGVMLGFIGIMVGRIISKETDELIKSEDERAKKLIAEGNERLERMNQSARETREFVISLIVSDGEKTRELIKEKILNLTSPLKTVNLLSIKDLTFQM